MKKSELMTADVVVSTKGSLGFVLRGTPRGDLIKWFKNKKGEDIQKYRSLDMVNEDLTFKFDGNDNRIIEVYRATNPHDVLTPYTLENKYLIWEEKVKEVTIAELEELYGCKVKIVGEN